MLVLGKRITKKDPSHVGGAIVLFEQLLKDLDAANLEHEVIDLNFRNYGNKLQGFRGVKSLILKKIWKHRIIMLNCSSRSFLIFAPLIFFCSSFKNNRIILRFFGGSFNKYLEGLPFILKTYTSRLLKRADLLFFEQNYQVDYFKKLNKNTHWFPNMRSIENRSNLLEENRRNYNHRFVFMSHIREEKGVSEILEVKKRLGSKIDLQLYGTRVNYVCPIHLKDVFDEVYKGALKPQEVYGVLVQNDVLLLPSYNEGYPGIIIEALAFGLPVIATRLLGIMEMIDEASGVLIDSQNVDQLEDAILHFNKNNYKSYSQNALEAFDQFDASIQMPRIFKLIFRE